MQLAVSQEQRWIKNKTGDLDGEKTLRNPFSQSNEELKQVVSKVFKTFR